MIATITVRAEVPSVQKLTALRDQLANLLDQDPDTTLIASSSARDSETYTVTAVDLGTKKKVEQQVETTSPEEAWAKVETDTVVVTDVRASG